MTDWFLAIEGTPQAHGIALTLALFAALSHAIFGALQKARFDPWVMRAGIDIAYGLMALPVALFIVPFPEPHMWPIFAGVWAIHAVYKVLQAAAYSKGSYTAVYPVVRGMGPFFTVIGAYFVFGEVFSIGQWFGVAVLLTGIFGLAGYNLKTVVIDRDTLPLALGLAVLTGLMVAAYTTYDAFGIRATENPFTFLAWFFVIDSWFIPLIVFLRRDRFSDIKYWRQIAPRGVFGGLVAFASFGAVMLATRLDSVGEAAVLRETSTVFAAGIGWLFLKETVGPRRIFLMALIALGAVIVEFAG